MSSKMQHRLIQKQMIPFVLGLALILSGQSSAQEQEKPADRRQSRQGQFRQGDQKGTRAQTQRRGRFGQPNQRDQMSPEMARRMIQRMIQSSDKDGDGEISAAEAPARLKNRFEKIDTDQNGRLTGSELGQAMLAARQQAGRRGMFEPGGRPAGQQPANQKKAQMKGDSDRPAQRGPAANRRNGMPGRRQLSTESLLRFMDKDRDGAISADEASDRLKGRFAQLDENGDQKLDKNELETMVKMLETMTGQGRGRNNENALKPKQPKRPPRNDG